MSWLRNMIMITLAVVAFAACERRPLVDVEFSTRIDVKVNIDAIPNITCDVYNEKIQIPKIEPIAMHALFFNQETGKVASEAFLSDIVIKENGDRIVRGNISVLPGTYKMLIYDFGTEVTVVDNYYDWDECKAYTNEVSPSVKRQFASKAGGEDAYIVHEPDHLTVACSGSEYIPYHADNHTISIDAKSVVESYYLQIKVKGLEYVSNAQAVLSGMVSSNLISSNTRVVEPQATIWFDLEKSDDEGVPVICTVFNTFGRIEDSFNDLEVTFDLKTHDGHVVQESFEISDLFLTEACKEHHWLLLDEEIVVPPPLSAGGGFAPEVNDWEEENSEIII